MAEHRVAGLLEAGLTAYACPVRFELMSGMKAGEEADLERVFGFSRHIPFAPEDWRTAAILERGVRTKGLTVPRSDLFEIAVAVRVGMEVVCRDEHFNAFARLLGDRLKVGQI